MSESQAERGRRHSDDQLAAEQPLPHKQEVEADDEFDSLLDEIDDVLEVNAEEFVRSFVQKGGQ